MTTINDILAPPDQWQFSTFFNRHGKLFRWGWNCPQNAKGLVVLTEGRTECIEEYFEIIRDLNARGYACAIMDWQGQGLSWRYFDDQTRHHSEGFHLDVEDFEAFMGVVEQQEAIQSLPKFLLAHSMGSAITLRYMALHHQVFQSAFLIAPMLGLEPRNLIRYGAKMILRAVKSFDFLHKHAPGQGAWSETFYALTMHKISGHKQRRNIQRHLFKTRPELQCGGVTFGWLDEALKTIEILNDSRITGAISTPVVMALAGQEAVVDNAGAYRVAALIPHCKILHYDDAQHQIHRETDTIRNQLLQDIESVFTSIHGKNDAV